MSDQITQIEHNRVDHTSQEWNELREKRLAEDNHQCANCGSTEDLQVHHIVPDSRGGTTLLSNLRTLCYDCHNKAHKGINLPGAPTESNTRWLPTVDDAQDVLAASNHPLHRAIFILLAKTGIRLGELCELTPEHVYLRRNPLKPNQGGQVLNHIVVPEAEEQRAGGPNGRLTDTRIPLDSEVAKVLRQYLAIRPDPVGENRLFLGTTEDWGTPVTPDSVHHYVTEMARGVGHYEDGAGATQNLTPRTLRKFFRDRFRGQPAVREYILGAKKEAPWPFGRIAADYRYGIYRLLE